MREPGPDQREAARRIRQSLFDIRHRAEAAGYDQVSRFLNLAIVEASHLAGEDNVIEMQKKK